MQKSQLMKFKEFIQIQSSNYEDKRDHYGELADAYDNLLQALIDVEYLEEKE